MDTLYTFWDNITHTRTKSVHFWGPLNSATKSCQIVKFKLPPRMTQRKLEKLELEDEAMNHFQPSRDLSFLGFRVSEVFEFQDFRSFRYQGFRSFRVSGC